MIARDAQDRTAPLQDFPGFGRPGFVASALASLARRTNDVKLPTALRSIASIAAMLSPSVALRARLAG
ncbi:MAG TPA: hypothetical protein VJV78_47790 [Polyangiales bacterium]|nr:hypothetical protein [Polyangiales bacterium]